MTELEQLAQTAASMHRQGHVLEPVHVQALVDLLGQQSTIHGTRVKDLLDANNRYLDRAQAAEMGRNYQSSMARDWKFVAKRSIDRETRARIELSDARNLVKKLERQIETERQAAGHKPNTTVDLTPIQAIANVFKRFGAGMRPFLDGRDIEPLAFRYRNYRGEIAIRTVLPLNIYYGSTEWHPAEQWLLAATDLEKGERRDFAIKDINPPFSTKKEIEALQNAIEGECEGLAISEEQAQAILKHVIWEQP